MTTARKTKPTKNPRAPKSKAKLELVGNPRPVRRADEDLKYGPDHPKNNPSRRKRRRKHRRKKNMSTGGKIAIVAAVVLVGIPLVLVTAGALGFRALVKKAEKDMPPLETRPMQGSEKGYNWTIEGSPGSYRWTVWQDAFGTPLLNGPQHTGTASTYESARSEIDIDIAMR